MIVAVDFDGILCESCYPDIGEPIFENITMIKNRKASGDKIILWTCRCGKYLDAALEWCRKYGIEFDAVNENIPERREKYGNDCRKISADIYIDDKAYNPFAIGDPCDICKHGRECKAPLNFAGCFDCKACEFGGACIGCAEHSHFAFHEREVCREE